MGRFRERFVYLFCHIHGEKKRIQYVIHAGNMCIPAMHVMLILLKDCKRLHNFNYLFVNVTRFMHLIHFDDTFYCLYIYVHYIHFDDRLKTIKYNKSLIHFEQLLF